MPYKNIEDQRQHRRNYIRKRRAAGLDKYPKSMQSKQQQIKWRRENRERLNQWGKDWRAKNPEARKRIELRSKLKKLGVTLGEYDTAFKRQHGLCAVCGSAENGLKGTRLAIDHCHKSGRLRGLLCGHCNAALGMVDDDIALLKRMISYLRRHAPPSEDGRIDI